MFYSENDIYLDSYSELNIIKCGKRFRAENHNFGPIIRKNYWLIFVKNGNGTLYTNDKSYEFSNNSIICTFPNCEFHYVFNGTADIYWLCFNQGFPALLKDIGLSKNNPIKQINNFTQIESIYENIYTLSSSNLQKDQYKILSLFYQLFSLLTDSKKFIKIPSQNYVEFAIRYIENNYADDIYMSDISKILGIECTYFSKIFKNETGVSPNKYLLDLRINKACSILRTSNMSINQVATSVGINDPFYFSKIFKRCMGMSPKEYAKKKP